MRDGSDSPAWIAPRRDAAIVTACAIFCLLGMVFIIGAAGLDFGSAMLPGPGMFPFLAAVVMTVLSAIMGGRALVSLGSEAGTPIAIGHRNSGLAAAMLFAMALLFERVGVLVTSFIFVAILAWVLSTSRLWQILIYAAVVTAVIVIGFGRFLGVALPVGILGAF